MQYNLIEIYPIHTFKRGKIDPNGKQKWGISGLIDKTDRVKTKSVPNAGGFYHYPVSMPEEIAFNELKQVMINAHKERIEATQRSLTDLEALKFQSKK